MSSKPGVTEPRLRLSNIAGFTITRLNRCGHVLLWEAGQTIFLIGLPRSVFSEPDPGVLASERASGHEKASFSGLSIALELSKHRISFFRPLGFSRMTPKASPSYRTFLCSLPFCSCWIDIPVSRVLARDKGHA